MKSKSVHQDVYISIAVYIALIFLLTVSVKLPVDSAIFPNMLIVGLGILNTFVLIKGINKTKSTMSDKSSIINPIRWEVIKVPLIVFLLTIAYVTLFTFTNFFIATTIFMIAVLKFYKVKSWKTIIIVTLLFNVIIYVGFQKMLNVQLL